MGMGAALPFGRLKFPSQTAGGGGALDRRKLPKPEACLPALVYFSCSVSTTRGWLRLRLWLPQEAALVSSATLELALLCF